VLLGKRKDSGLYGLPGGWLELYEEWEECAARELKEEANLSLEKSRFSHIDTFNCISLENNNYHSISLIMYAEIQSKEIKSIKNLEPKKCEKWEWMSIDEMREKINELFYPLKQFLLRYDNIRGTDDLKKLIRKSFTFTFTPKYKIKNQELEFTESPTYISTIEDDLEFESKESLMI